MCIRDRINSFWSDTMRNAKYDIKDRLKASELRARAAGGFVDKGEHSICLLYTSRCV